MRLTPWLLAPACFAALTWPAAAAGNAAPADPLAEFARSDIAGRLTAVGHQLLAAAEIAPGEILVADYVPEQSALSEWDDETRLVLYRRDAQGRYERKQFVSKAGDSAKGRMGGWQFADLDGDGQKEILIIGAPVGLAGHVVSQVFRRSSPDARFERIWQGKHTSAAWKLEGRTLLYTYLDPTPPHARRFERLTWRDGQLR